MFEVAQCLNVHKPIPTNTYASLHCASPWSRKTSLVTLSTQVILALVKD